MYREPLQEDLLDELTRLVGRPQPVVQDALARLLQCLDRHFETDALGALGDYPMTAWPAIAHDPQGTDLLWRTMMAAGLSAEEVLTALAVVDDHVRRRYGNRAWARVREWGPLMAGRYDLACAPEAPAWRPTPRA